ncbi:transposase [Sinorhizobium medicae]|nr:transposase [Sinorhizobium medicae]MDX0691730.1 transposase [Sinorhizobium medicae]
MRFVAMDVETANARMRSICQIGLVVFEDGREIACGSHLVDPDEEFDFFNIAVHGITPHHIAGKPKFSQIQDWLLRHTDGQTIVSHTHFDRTSLAQALAHHSLPPVNSTWLDTAKVARRAWSQFASSGYGLANLAREFGISFKHHDALDDARTCGVILCRAIHETGLTLDEWVNRCKLGISEPANGREKRSGDGDGPLLGETLVFTGALSIPRKEAADLAHYAGGRVDPGVTRETTILVVGDQDLDKLAGRAKSSKHRKAEQLAAAGQTIRFLAETDFLASVRESH